MAEQDRNRQPSETGKAMHEARQQAEKLSDRAMEQGRSLFDNQKDNAARQVDSVAHAFRNTAGQLSGEGQSQAGQYVGMAADRLESLGRQLRQKDLDTMVNDVQDLGRRAPGAFFAGSVVAGFLLARFMKSSADRHRGSMSSRSDWRRDAMHGDDRTGPMSGPHGSGSHDDLHPAGGRAGSHTPAGTSPMAGSAGTGSVGTGGTGGMSGTSSTGSTGGTTGTAGPSTPPGSGGPTTGGIHGNR
jgi:hypothetical protein